MKLKASLALAFGLLSGMAYSATELVIATCGGPGRLDSHRGGIS